jgi:hypothetical protein
MSDPIRQVCPDDVRRDHRLRIAVPQAVKRFKLSFSNFNYNEMKTILNFILSETAVWVQYCLNNWTNVPSLVIQK